MQNIPSEEVTRSCFVSQKGYNLVCADYSGQESVVLTNYSMEPKLLDFFDNGAGDLHSYVAKLTFPKEIGNTPLKDIKKLFHALRNAAKACEFAIAYGGNGDTIANNLNLSKEEGKRIYIQYLEAFSGLKDYFEHVKKLIWERGYALISNITGHKSYIYDFKELKSVEARLNNEFWNGYKQYKPSYDREAFWSRVPDNSRKSIIRQIFSKFANGDSIDSIVGKYDYIKGSTTSGVYITKGCVYVEIIKRFYKRKSSSERMALNYPIQGCSAQISKIACIKYFNHLINKGLLFKVLIPNVIHDEILSECPEEIAKQEAITLQKCMESAGDIFCKRIKLTAEPQIGTYWIH